MIKNNQKIQLFNKNIKSLLEYFKFWFDTVEISEYISTRREEFSIQIKVVEEHFKNFLKTENAADGSSLNIIVSQIESLKFGKIFDNLLLQL